MRRFRRGFSLIELLIAAGLSVMFAGLVSVALINSMSMAQDSLVKGTLEQRARTLGDTMLFFLRGAGPPGVCLDPNSPSGWPLSDCQSVGESSSAFAEASTVSMTFYSYATQLDATAGASASVLAVPDKVVFRFDGSRVLIERYAPAASATYTSPSWVPLPEVVRDMPASAPTSGPLFAFFDSTGVSLVGPSGSVAPADLPRVALVEVHPRVTSTAAGQEESSGVDLAIAVVPGLAGGSP